MAIFGLLPDPPSPGDIFWYKVHGSLLFLAFGVLFPFGLFGVKVSRYYKKYRCLFKYHWVVQLAGVLCVIWAVLISFCKFEDKKKSKHGTIGQILPVLLILHCALAAYRPKKECEWRCCWEWCHWLIGTGSTVVGLLNIVLGLGWFYSDWTDASCQKLLTWLFTFYVSFLIIGYLAFDKCHAQKPDPDCDPDDTWTPLLSKEDKAVPIVRTGQFLARV